VEIKMIKKHKNKNKYILEDKLYVRDFTNYDCIPVDLNQLTSFEDQNVFIENEMNNFQRKYSEFELNKHEKIIIVNDGYGFQEKHLLLSQVDKDVCIIAVNGALKEWRLIKKISGLERSVNYYLVNNPYEECKNYIPENHSYYPKCIASTRTNSDFLNLYKGNKHLYSPTPNNSFSSLFDYKLKVDDYRNVICAGLDISFKFNASKIFLYCCDDSFEKNKPGSISMENGLRCYPQQLISEKIIGNMCYWLKNKNIEIYNYSNGNIINNTTQLKNDEEFLTALST